MEYDPDIFDAVEFGDLRSVKMYWTKDIDIDFQERNGMTMLMLASYYGFEDILEFLLSHKPNLYLKNKEGKTALELTKYENVYRILHDKMK